MVKMMTSIFLSSTDLFSFKSLSTQPTTILVSDL